MSLGVCAGATTPNQALASNPGTPDSATLGTFGSGGKGSRVVVAMARSLPCCMYGKTAVAVWKPMSITPAIWSTSAGPAPL